MTTTVSLDTNAHLNEIYDTTNQRLLNASQLGQSILNIPLILPRHLNPINLIDNRDLSPRHGRNIRKNLMEIESKASQSTIRRQPGFGDPVERDRDQLFIRVVNQGQEIIFAVFLEDAALSLVVFVVEHRGDIQLADPWHLPTTQISVCSIPLDQKRLTSSRSLFF